jgi:hypothetical protein
LVDGIGIPIKRNAVREDFQRIPFSSFLDNLYLLYYTAYPKLLTFGRRSTTTYSDFWRVIIASVKRVID